MEMLPKNPAEVRKAQYDESPHARGVDLTVQQLAQASALVRALHARVNVPPLQPSGLVPDYALPSQLPVERVALAYK